MSAQPLRFAAVAAAICLAISPVVLAIGTAPESAAAPPSSAPTPAASSPAPPAPADAAARHAKRTACLKDAKTKKLVGAEKSAFLKTCIAAP